jgi:hypothetical protein
VETKVILITNPTKYTVGLCREKPYNTLFKFWNPFFPTSYLKPTLPFCIMEEADDLHIKHNIEMIEEPLPNWKLKWRKICLKLFNFRILNIEVITKSDPTILRYGD